MKTKIRYEIIKWFLTTFLKYKYIAECGEGKYTKEEGVMNWRKTGEILGK